MDLLEVYPVIEEIIKYFKKSTLVYNENIEESVTDERAIIRCESGMRDEFPYFWSKTIGGKIFRGKYRIKFDFSNNIINFTFILPGSGHPYVAGRIPLDTKGRADYCKIKDKVDLIKCEKEFNEKFLKKYRLNFIFGENSNVNDNEYAILRVEIQSSWNLNDGSTIDEFKTEFFEKVLPGLKSPEVTDFIKNKIFPLYGEDKLL